MIGFIIWVIGIVLAVKAVLEIMKWPVNGVKKLLVAIVILLTSWIGICVYYFWGRENLPQMLKKAPALLDTEVKQTCIGWEPHGECFPPDLCFRIHPPHIHNRLSPSFQKISRTLSKQLLIAFRKVRRRRETHFIRNLCNRHFRGSQQRCSLLQPHPAQQFVGRIVGE